MNVGAVTEMSGGAGYAGGMPERAETGHGEATPDQLTGIDQLSSDINDERVRYGSTPMSSDATPDASVLVWTDQGKASLYSSSLQFVRQSGDAGDTSRALAVVDRVHYPSGAQITQMLVCYGTTVVRQKGGQIVESGFATADEMTKALGKILTTMRERPDLTLIDGADLLNEA